MGPTYTSQNLLSPQTLHPYQHRQLPLDIHENTIQREDDRGMELCWTQTLEQRLSTHALRYLYDDFAAASPGVTPPFNVWQQPWPLEDRSEDLLRQGNSYD